MLLGIRLRIHQKPPTPYDSDSGSDSTTLFCPIPTGRRDDHTQFAQAGTETSETGTEAVKPDLRCSWKSLFRRVGAGVGDENAESWSVVHPLRIPLVIRPVCRARTSIVVIGWTDELLCGGYKWVSRLETPCICTRWTVSAEWCGCPGSMTRHSRDSVAPLRWNSAGWMPARIERLSAGVGRRH